jgi:hypothetical protein
MHLAEAVTLTTQLAASEMQCLILQARIEDLTARLAQAGDPFEPQCDGPGLSPALDRDLEEARAQALTQRERAASLAEENERLVGWLKDREDRLNQLSTEWEQQGARIMELENQLATQPRACPQCETPLVLEKTIARAEPGPSSDAVSFTKNKAKLKPKRLCRVCKTEFIPNLYYKAFCSDKCRPPGGRKSA